MRLSRENLAVSVFLAHSQDWSQWPAASRLSLPSPPRKGPGGLPRLLTLAIEKVDYFYYYPKDIPFLFYQKSRKRRTERRASCILLLKALLKRLDLGSMKCVMPDPRFGLIDLNTEKLMQDTGLEKRRVERAMADLVSAGFVETNQPRILTANSRYMGCRSIRKIKPKLFSWLGLSIVYKREQDKSKGRKAEAAIREKQKETVSSALPDFVTPGAVAEGDGPSKHTADWLALFRRTFNLAPPGSFSNTSDRPPPEPSNTLDDRPSPRSLSAVLPFKGV